MRQLEALNIKAILIAIGDKMKNVSELSIMITGSTDGLGRAVALELAPLGCKLILHGRNEEKLHILTDEISNLGNPHSIYYISDFSSLDTVNKMADKILSDKVKIDVLINNAGIYTIGGNTERAFSKDGIEMRFAVNYVSHVLLTEKLLPIINRGGRILNISSIGQEDIDFDDIMMDKNYNVSRAYCQSKLAQIMYTFDLAHRLKERSISVNALHPSTYMNTTMVLIHHGKTESKIEDGVKAVMNLTVNESNEGITGQYFNVLNSEKAIPQAYDSIAREKLSKITKGFLKDYL